MIPFPPVIEPDIPGAFITKHPRDEYEPHAIELPWMTGLTFDEGALKSACEYFFQARRMFSDAVDMLIDLYVLIM